MSLPGFLLRRSRGAALLAIAAAAVNGLGGVGLIALIHAELGRPIPSMGLLGVAFAGLCVLVAGARVAAQVGMARMGQEAVAEMAVRLCRGTLALPLAKFEALNSSTLLAVLTEDVIIVAGALAGVPQIAINLPLVAVCLVYVGWLSPTVLACGFVFAAMAVGLYLALVSPAMAHFEAARAGQDTLVGHYRSLIDGFRELKLHDGRRSAFVDRGLIPAAGRVRDRTIRGQMFFAMAEGWGEMAFFAFLGFLLFVLPIFRPLDRSTLVGVVLVVLYVIGPLGVILTWLPVMGRARASLRRIEDFLPELQDVEAESPRRESVLAVRHSIRLEGVAHVYPFDDEGAGFLLGPLDLTLRPGEIVILCGGNGSGKTTLVKLIAGLYDPAAGTLLLDDEPIGPEDLPGYRGLFTAVFADGHLFPDLRGLERPDLASMAEAELRRFGLSERVHLVEDAYSTTELSQGQRRRLALISALLEDRPVLILDEWAANQDPAWRRLFYRHILPELRDLGKAILVISHDEDDFDVADRVIRLRDGRIVEEMAAVAAGEGAP